MARGTFGWYDTQRELVEFAANTDAGNSGGPVVDEDVHVIGLVSYAITGEAGVMYLASSSNKIIELCRKAGAPFQLAAVRPPDYVVDESQGQHGMDEVLVYGAAAGAATALLVAAVARGGGR